MMTCGEISASLTLWQAVPTIAPSDNHALTDISRPAHSHPVGVKEGIVRENRRAQALFTAAFAGRIDRRALLKRAAAVGISAPVAAALAQETLRGALAAKEGQLNVVYDQRIIGLHPPIQAINNDFNNTLQAQGMRLNADVAPVNGFGYDRFIAEAKQGTSTWDVYIGVRPYLDMIQLVESGAFEPWDEYLPAGLADDVLPPIRPESTYDGKFYVWPCLLDAIGQAWNSEQVEKAGLDPETMSQNWDDFIANATKVKKSGVARFGATFDIHAWCSLLPITQSISTDVYDPDTGLFMWNSDAAVQALEIMKRMYEVANPELVNAGGADAGAHDTPDEKAFAAQQVAYYIKYPNAPLHAASGWPDPSKLRLSALPLEKVGAGGTVFWDTGAVLFKYGKNKPQAAKYLKTLTYDQRIWEDSVVGKPPKEIAAGQLPIYQSLWDAYKEDPPEWLEENTWPFTIRDGLDQARAIAPTKLGVTQFDVAMPFYVDYLKGNEKDAKTALTKAMDAVTKKYNK
jgi:hypothetical protein